MRQTVKFTFLLILLILLAGCAGPKTVSKTYHGPEVWMAQGWRSAALAPQNLGSTVLAQRLEPLLSKPINLHVVLVIRTGTIAVEADCPQGFGANPAGKSGTAAFQVSYQGDGVGITMRTLETGGVALIYSGIQWPL